MAEQALIKHRAKQAGNPSSVRVPAPSIPMRSQSTMRVQGGLAGPTKMQMDIVASYLDELKAFHCRKRWDKLGRLKFTSQVKAMKERL